MRELATPVVPRNARVEAAARDVNACGHRRAIGALIRAVQQPLGSRLARRRKRKGALHFRALDALFPLSEPMFLCSYNRRTLLIYSPTTHLAAALRSWGRPWLPYRSTNKRAVGVVADASNGELSIVRSFRRPNTLHRTRRANVQTSGTRTHATRRDTKSRHSAHSDCDTISLTLFANAAQTYQVHQDTFRTPDRTPNPVLCVARGLPPAHAACQP